VFTLDCTIYKKSDIQNVKQDTKVLLAGVFRSYSFVYNVIVTALLCRLQKYKSALNSYLLVSSETGEQILYDCALDVLIGNRKS
jgi:hypothetical protein